MFSQVPLDFVNHFTSVVLEDIGLEIDQEETESKTDYHQAMLKTLKINLYLSKSI
jgi:hypothetical protein